MTTGIILAIAALVILLASLVFIKVQPVRKPSLEGIEDVRAAKAYDRISKWPQFRALRRLIVREIRKHRPTGILADIGCGPGLLTLLIAKKFPQLKVLGLDTAQEMIKTANRNALSLGFQGRVEFQEGNIHSLPVPDHTLDFAVSSIMPLSAIVSRKIGEMIHKMDRCPADFHGIEKAVIENKSFPGRVFLDVAVEGFPNDWSRQGRFDFNRVPLIDDEIDLGFGFCPPVFHFSVRL